VATVSAFLGVPPEAVWRVLADPATYPRWVVGCRGIRWADDEWPAPGAAFGHTFGLPLAAVRDRTVVLECEPGHRLVLEARAQVGAARVELTLERAATGTEVRMDERPLRPWPARLARPWLVAPTLARNTLTLRRLASVAAR
jgi:uncharacterized protein YndB with AHSA1/START domain